MYILEDCDRPSGCAVDDTLEEQTYINSADQPAQQLRHKSDLQKLI